MEELPGRIPPRARDEAQPAIVRKSAHPFFKRVPAKLTAGGFQSSRTILEPFRFLMESRNTPRLLFVVLLIAKPVPTFPEAL